MKKEIHYLLDHDILNQKFEEYFKSVYENSELIDNWFLKYDCPIVVDYTLGYKWKHKALYNKKELFDFFNLVICARIKNANLSWFFSIDISEYTRGLSEREKNKIYDAMLDYTHWINAGFLTILKSSDVPLNYTEEKTLARIEERYTANVSL